MRIVWVGGWFFCALGCAACGGSEAASGGAKSAEVSADVHASPSAAPPATSEPATTTTALGSSGDASGTKLPEAPGSAPPASSALAGQGARAHEPGRGVADIRAIVIAHRDEARACYDKALPNHPGMEGDLVISFTIDPKGSVSKISLDTARSQITDPDVAACVMDIIKKIQFASSPGGYETRASYPFNFHPRRAQQ